MSYNTASKCPGSVGAHALRCGYATEALDTGQPCDVTADRVDMTTETLDKHYDHEKRRMECRKD